LTSPNSDLALNPPVKAGEVYKIINCHTGTIVQLEDSNNGVFVSAVPWLKYSLTFIVPCHSISCWVQLQRRSQPEGDYFKLDNDPQPRGSLFLLPVH
jgi:hypothetical protein